MRIIFLLGALLLRVQPGMSAEAEQHLPSVAEHKRVSAFARLEPREGVRTLTGPSTDFAFRVDQLRVTPGAMVKKGEPLAILDIAKQRAAELAIADADVNLAKVQLDLAQKKLERRRALMVSSSPSLSREDMDTADNAYAVAKATLIKLQRQRDLQAVLTEQSTIRAPDDGMVLRILKQEGEGVSANDGILEFGDVLHMEAVAEVFETDGRLVHPGARVTFTSPALASPIAGTVRFVAPKIDRMSIYSSDPASNTEGRVIRVYVSLEDSVAVRRLTGLQGMASIEADPSP
jgi:multidrug efflux pump subunit AcrA (membrane-fusion protein)